MASLSAETRTRAAVSHWHQRKPHEGMLPHLPRGSGGHSPFEGSRLESLHLPIHAPSGQQSALCRRTVVRRELRPQARAPAPAGQGKTEQSPSVDANGHDAAVPIGIKLSDAETWPRISEVARRGGCPSEETYFQPFTCPVGPEAIDVNRTRRCRALPPWSGYGGSPEKPRPSGKAFLPSPTCPSAEKIGRDPCRLRALAAHDDAQYGLAPHP